MRLFRKIFETTGSIIAAKKSLMSKALSIHYGPEYEEILEGLVISEKVKDFQVALLFTNLDKESVESQVKDFGSDRFSIPGDVAEKTIFISNENLESCPSSMQPYLEKIGVPVVVKDGAIILLQNPMQVTTEGEILTANQAKILKCFKIRISRSSMTLHKAISTKELVDI
ncbi:MAG: mRNA turnover 4 [Marteilia pararefringens]